MKRLLLFTGLVALAVCLVGVPDASAQEGTDDNGLHNGMVQGCGHEGCLGKGLGHDKHGCDAECPLCGGNPCIPPCPGVAASSMYHDVIGIYEEVSEFIVATLFGWTEDNEVLE